MLRFLLFLCLSIEWSGTSFGALYAIAPCDGMSIKSITDQCSRQSIEVITPDPQSGYVLVNSEADRLSTFCYYTEVRQAGNYLCYNTNKLLVKAENLSDDLIRENGLIPNRFVPGLFSVEPPVRNEEELKVFRAELLATEGISYVGFNQVFTMDLSVNDPLYYRQWSLENNGTPAQYNGTPGADMSVDAAWAITTGSDWVRIAILDSGVDTLHEDLTNNLLPGFDGFATDSTDTQGHPTPNYSMDGHGTSCAGIVAAEGDNGLGIAGVSYGSRIIPVRVFYYVNYGAPVGIQATTSTQALVDGAAFAWRDAGADIISCSAGLPDLFIGLLGIDTALVNAELVAASYEARNWKGIAMFFSSGNDNTSDVLWPANHPKTIAVGASSMCDERKSPTSCDGENWGGNYGPGLDLIAPGVKVTTTDMTGSQGFSGNNYTYTFNGTSAACPNAAGVGALILSVNYGLSGEDVRAILNLTADRVSGYVYDSISPYGTWNNEAGHGRVNALSAVQLAQTYVSTVGITEVENNAPNVFPNPFSNSLFLDLGSVSGEWDIEITDMQGRLVHRSAVTGPGTYLLDADMDRAVYFLSASNGDQCKVIRILKE